MNVAGVNRILDDESKLMVNLIYVTPDVDKARNGYRCMWCTLEINGKPIGCPTNCVTASKVNNKKEDRKKSTTYETFGIFCSFNCAKSYALDRSHNPLFKNSPRLLAAMYADVYEIDSSTDPITILPSPPITLMSAYGGDMSEDHYRNLISKKTYVDKGILKMFPLTMTYEEFDTIIIPQQRKK